MSDKIFCCKLLDTSESPEITTELLTALDFHFSSWIDKEEAKLAFHTIYTEIEGDEISAADTVKALIEDWGTFGVVIEDVETFSIEKEDWSEVWKKYFDIQHITDTIVVKPSWLDYEPKPNQVIIEIDPGMSFGTGKHATTSFCLRMLEKLHNDSSINNLLDAGVGSGILSIAASHFGYKNISAFDIDEMAVGIAEENLLINNVDMNNINLRTCDLSDYNKEEAKFDFVIANILGHILLANKEKLMALLHKDSYIVLSGVLTTEFDEFSDTFCSLGLEEILRETENEWTGGLFRKK